ncbi:50S ribosomal protein L9 [Candidatus Atribacteria bacterium RBG_19FT_COMBO_35_14]|uniref:Large ribosomal subunit protein bL9 n=1 Tax=Candidatus Sediminicultor quintus TaxID=1797291 RepID=A0A1F5ABI2_9BACT|nr:MAG: 50S ribosomal protein L9 [Candidatus Atribacteria bacterium RBG_19FT_COMBO_35_14]OGD37424.1 MAG: 50S ribosomal protein L9 [Candidatus Atribacteria bacterium RBG_16_35_8]
MKIILKQNMEKIGQAGEVVEVSDGFARNFLIPQGKAISFSAGNFKQIEYLKKREVEQRDGELKEVKELAVKISNISLEIKVKAGEEGKLFGSVTSKDIVEVLLKEHGIELDKKKLNLKESLKKLGVHIVPINLYKDVTPQIKVTLISDYASEQETEDTKKE